MSVICNLDLFFVKDKLSKNAHNFVRHEFIDIYKTVVCVFLVFFTSILTIKYKMWTRYFIYINEREVT